MARVSKQGILLLILLAMLPQMALARERKPLPEKMPIQIVSDLFRPYMNDDNSIDTDAFRFIVKVATPELARLVLADRKCVRTTREVCRLDFDPIIWAQDWKIRDFSLHVSNDQSDRQSVFVQFYHFNEVRKIQFDFILIKSRWFLSDIQGYDERFGTMSLLQILQGKIY